MTVSDPLPADVLKGASLRGNEWGWTVSEFPKALEHAEAHGYACLGGQFQFRLPNGRTCEMYWLSADSADRRDGETWIEYTRRSCSEVFRKRVSETDFAKEALAWHLSIDDQGDLVFVAYFITETELAELTTHRTR